MAEKILLVKAHGLGNLIMATPAMRKLREIYKDAEITLLCAAEISYQASKMALEGKLVDRVIKDITSPLDVDRLISFNKEVNVNGVRITSGNISVNPFRMSDLCSNEEDIPHEVGSYFLAAGFKIIDAVGSKTEFLMPEPDIELHTELPPVAMMPYCVNTPPYKVWNPKRWAQLASILIEDGLHPVFIGSDCQNQFNDKYDWASDSAEILKELQSIADDGEYTWLCDTLDLKDALAITQQCVAGIGVDCGLVHFADSQDIPTLSLYGPTWEHKNLAWNKGICIRGCKPCLPRTQCEIHGSTRNCMDLISVDSTYRAFSRMLEDEINRSASC